MTLLQQLSSSKNRMYRFIKNFQKDNLLEKIRIYDEIHGKEAKSRFGATPFGRSFSFMAASNFNILNANILYILFFKRSVVFFCYEIFKRSLRGLIHCNYKLLINK